MRAVKTPYPNTHIGSVVRNAVAFDFKNWRGDIVNTDALLQAVVRLFALLRERRIDYVLVGGIALLQYTEGRNTEDIDLIMAAASLTRLPEIEVVNQDINFAHGKFDDLQINLFLTRNPLFAKVRENYTTNQPFIEQEIRCATVEGLLLLKLYALPSVYRQGNFSRAGIYETDIATLIYDHNPALGPLLVALADHLSEADLSAVRDIVADIQQRIDSFGKSFDREE